MGEVLEFRPRHGQEPGEQVEAGFSHAQDPAQLVETPNLPAVIEPDHVELAPAIPEQFAQRTNRPAPRLQRPEWLGVKRQHRRALGRAVWRQIRRGFGRLLFETFKGVTVRVGRVVRWFVLGSCKGGFRLVRWGFAMDERTDITSPPTGSLRGAPGKATRVGARADHLAWFPGGA